MRYTAAFLIALLPFLAGQAQEILPDRYTSYDVLSYDLEMKLDPDKQRIAGTSRIVLRVAQPFDQIDLDLHAAMRVLSVRQDRAELRFAQRGDTLRLFWPARTRKSAILSLEITYGGSPGPGRFFGQDLFGKTYISFQQPGLRPSHWWPVKLGRPDLADSIRMAVVFPDELRVVSNGLARGEERLPGNFRRWRFTFGGPVSPEFPAISIGDYIRLGEKHRNAAGQHDLYYYVLAYREAAAMAYLRQVRPILSLLEKYYGACPLPASGLVWIEPPARALQSSGAPADLGDPEMIRYLASHWFGQSLAPARPEDEGLLEAFLGYSELLFAEQAGGEAAAIAYLKKQTSPWYQGAGMLHALRSALDDDARWFETLGAFVREHRGRSVSRADWIETLRLRLGEDMAAWFEERMMHNRIPVLQYRISANGRKTSLEYRWQTESQTFGFPVTARLGSSEELLYPARQWQQITRKGLKPQEIGFTAIPGFYEVQQVE